MDRLPAQSAARNGRNFHRTFRTTDAWANFTPFQRRRSETSVRAAASSSALMRAAHPIRQWGGCDGSTRGFAYGGSTELAGARTLYANCTTTWVSALRMFVVRARKGDQRRTG